MAVALGSRFSPREHPNARAVARHFEQCETEGILLATEQPPISPSLSFASQ
jgi:hypothetical protein